MNPDQPSRFLISWGRAGELAIPDPQAPPSPGPLSRGAAPAPTKQLTQQGGDGGGGGEWHCSHGIFLSGWGGGLFHFPHLFRSPAPPVFPNLYLQRDSLALELFAAGCCVTSPVPTPEDKRKSKRKKGYEVKFFFNLFFLEKRPFRVFLDNKVKKTIEQGETLRGKIFFASFPPPLFSSIFFSFGFSYFYNFLLHL